MQLPLPETGTGAWKKEKGVTREEDVYAEKIDFGYFRGIYSDPGDCGSDQSGGKYNQYGYRWESGDFCVDSGGVPGLFILFCIALVSTTLNAFIPKIPTIIWITFIRIILAMPYSPTGAFVAEEVNKIGMLPAVTPILAYAGVSMGKDWTEFKKIGWRGLLLQSLS